MTADMAVAAKESGSNDVSSSVDAASGKPHRGTGVFLPRAAAGSRVSQRPHAASAGTQMHSQQQQQQQGISRSYSGSGNSSPWPGPQLQPQSGPIDSSMNGSSTRSRSYSSSIPVPMPTRRPGSARPLSLAGTSSNNSSRPYLQEPRCHSHHSAPLAHPVAAQYAAAAAAAFAGGALQEEHDDIMYLPGSGLGFTELSDGVLGGSPGACSDTLLFGLGSLPGGQLAGNGCSPAGNSLTAAAELNRSLAQLQGSSYGDYTARDMLSCSVGATAAHWAQSKAFDQQQQQQVQAARASSGLAGNSSSGSSMMQRGQWAASSPLPHSVSAPLLARDFTASRGAAQMIPRQPSTTAHDAYGFGDAQQLDTAAVSDQLLGSSYQQQQQQMQQMLLAGSSIACSPVTEADADVFLTGCSPLGTACASSCLAAASSSLGMPGQQQQQQGVRRQGRTFNSDQPLLWSAQEQQLHNQIGSSSSSSALQPLMRSSSQELQAVHAINAQLEQLLKLKEEVLAAKASEQGLRVPAASTAAAAAAVASSPLPATAPVSASAAAVYAPASNTRFELPPALGRMSSLPEHIQHNDYQHYQQQQQQQEFFLGGDLQEQQQQQQLVLGTSLGSAGIAVPSSFHLALGLQDNMLPPATSEMPVRSRRSSSSGKYRSSRMDPRMVVGSWSGEGYSSSGLAALEMARQKQAVRAVTEQKLQQLAALQRMQSNLQEELLQMLQ